MAEHQLDDEDAFAAAMRQMAKAEPVLDEAEAEHGAIQALKQLAPAPEARTADTDEVGAFYDYEGEP
jgi:hypothetical protein